MVTLAEAIGGGQIENMDCLTMENSTLYAMLHFCK